MFSDPRPCAPNASFEANERSSGLFGAAGVEQQSN
jgi:hypothetical protein